MALAPVRRIADAVLKDLGLPEDMFTFVNFPTRYDSREALAALKGSGIECPKLDDYAWRLWDYWERHLDPDLFIDRSLRGHGRRQGRARHRRLVGHRPGGGAQVRRGRRDHGHLRARRGQAGRGQARDPREGGQGRDRRDLLGRHRRRGELRGARRLAATTKHGGVDFLVNNAGRSIRRAIESELRPLPRLRADDAAQLLRLPARDDGLAARHGAPRRRATSSTSARSAC